MEALNPEREALWARLNAATFLTDDEKRAAAGYALHASDRRFRHSFVDPRLRGEAGSAEVFARSTARAWREVPMAGSGRTGVAAAEQ